MARFFHEKTAFVHDEMGKVSQVDYIKDLTLVAVVGEFGFGRVVGVGEYLLDPSSNMAEVAFSVSKDFKRKGLGKSFINKRCQAAFDKGIAGLFAYTSLENKAMIGLFKTLPSQVKQSFEDDMVVLRCRFDEPRADNETKKSGRRKPSNIEHQNGAPHEIQHSPFPATR